MMQKYLKSYSTKGKPVFVNNKSRHTSEVYHTEKNGILKFI